MKFGFFLRRLVLTGPWKKRAEVSFVRGLNVIAGPSDTGKSFILQCIDFALGSGDKPKAIPEAEGYDLVVLEIEVNGDQKVYQLKRSLKGGDVSCETDGQPNRVLSAKHKAGNEDTVSQFLLNLSGLGTKLVRTNDQGVTRPLSFRDIAKLVMIDEESVFKDGSPVLSGQFTLKTVEKGVFRLLLTGTDDSTIIAKEDPKVANGRQAGKIQLLESLLSTTRKRLADLGEFKTLREERNRLTQVGVAIQSALVERNAALAVVAPLQTKRNTTWTALRAVESKLVVLSELQARFGLLRKQYESDLRRLEAIAEAGLRLNQLKEERCPICGALAEHHGHAHRERQPETADILQACKAEAAKTFKLLQDLQITLSATEAEVNQLQDIRNTHQKDLGLISLELKGLMEQVVDVATFKVDSLRAQAETCRRAIDLLERIQELVELLEEEKKPKKKEKIVLGDSGVSTSQADLFCKEVEALLRAWRFPDLDRVTFSENNQDVVITGRDRSTHGKGVRAITRTAFNLGLLSFCIRDERPFPNFVIIDSPLLVYEEPDVGELSFPQDIKKHFWESVKTSFTDSQVIIIENSKQLPTDGTLEGVKVELFTGIDQGRQGFISLG